MAVKIPKYFSLERVKVVEWNSLANGDSGLPAEIARFSDKTIQIYGTFGSGGTVTIQGSNDLTKTNWFIVKDGNNNEITKTSSFGGVIMDNPLYLRPVITAGDGTTSITVVVCGKE